MSGQLTPDQKRDITELLYAGRKLEAIKQFRSLTGGSLSEAKTFLEELEATLREFSPERFEHPSSAEPTKISPLGCVVALVVLVLVAGALSWLVLA